MASFVVLLLGVGHEVVDVDVMCGRQLSRLMRNDTTQSLKSASCILQHCCLTP